MAAFLSASPSSHAHPHLSLFLYFHLSSLSPSPQVARYLMLGGHARLSNLRFLTPSVGGRAYAGGIDVCVIVA